MPLQAAVDRLRSKTAVASSLNTAQWQEIGLAMRDRAFFSSGVDSIERLAEMQAKIDEALTLSSRDSGQAFMSRSRFVAETRAALGAPEGDSGQLTDITSGKRLGLIYDFQKEDATEYGRWLADQDPAILDAYPCQELIRVEDRLQPRDWAARWADAGGRFFDGRMIATKDDPIWTTISRFGRPWPPFDFGSGMGVEDVSRDDAVALGVIEDSTVVKPTQEDFNAKLEASVPEATPAVLEGFQEIFGDQIDVTRDGKITWQGEKISKLYAAAMGSGNVQWNLDLGGASPETIAMAKQAGVDLTDYRLKIDADHLRKVIRDHGEAGLLGPGTGETLGNQQPISLLDLRMIPHIWRTPDSITTGDLPGDLLFSKNVDGSLRMVTWQVASNKTARLKTIYKKTGANPAPHVGP